MVRLRSLFLALSVLASVVGTGGVASASHTPERTAIGGFGIDGDFDFPSSPPVAGETRDWATVSPVVLVPDASNTQDDDAFGGGAKEEQPDNWTFVNQKAPGKDDLTRGYFAADVSGTDVASSKAFVWLGFERLDVQGVGDAHIDFELNQLATTVRNSVGTEVPERSDGDLLVVYDYPGGSLPVELEVRVWDGVDDDPSTAENENALFGTWNVVPAPPGSLAADLNEPAVARPAHAPFGGGTVESRRFGEAAVDLTEVLRGALSCPGFATFYAKSRASGESFNAQLKDKTPQADVDLSTCGTITVHKEDDEGARLDGAEFALYRDADGDGQFDRAADPQAGSCTSGEEGVTGQCTFNTPEGGEELPPGIYFVEEVAVPDGFVRDPTIATVDLGFREQEVVSHTFVDPKIRYRLRVDPPEDTNLVGTDHVFTATLQKCLQHIDTCSSDETAWVAAADENLAFALSGPGTITAIAPGGAVAGDGRGGSCVTGGDGTCTVTVRSEETGDSTLTATFDKQFATRSVQLQATGGKAWTNFELTVEPDDVNLVGEPHTFTVTLRRATEAGFAPEPGATIRLDWSGPAGSSITAVPAGSVAADGQSGTCTTDPNGQCTATVTSPATGSGTLTGTFDAVVGDTSASFPDTATKVWVDFALVVEPAGVNDVGTPHTFTVSLTQDEGAGFQPLAGETVQLQLDPGDTSGLIVAVAPEGSIAADGRSGTCTTDANGQCTVTVNSTLPGKAILTATWGKAIGADSTAAEQASASKVWLDAVVTKTSCPEEGTRATPGQQIDYDVTVLNPGTAPETALTGARLVDQLPAEVSFLAASAGGAYDAATHSVTWELGTVAPGATLAFSITGVVRSDTVSGTQATNTATLFADVIAPRVDTTTVLVTTEGASASGRAFGLQADLLGGGLLPSEPDVGPTPDTDTTNPDRLLAVDQAVADARVAVELLSVVNTSAVDTTGATDTAIATTSGVAITVPGVTLSATSVAAVSRTDASGFDATSTAAGSKIEDLVINGTVHGDVTNPDTIHVTDPATGEPIADVSVIETVPSGAAAGVTQPVAGFFGSGLTVNAIHIVVHDNPLTPVDESTEVIVAHAESNATFPSALACGQALPAVAGDAFLLDTPNVEPPAGAAQIGLVTLGATGGSETATVSDNSPLGLVTGQTHTEGALDPLAAQSSAVYNNANLLGGAVTATAISATVDSAPGTVTGSTTIADLVIAGTNVCEALGLGATCEPPPNTVLVLDEGNVIVLLNEQIVEDGGLRVNAVHIFVVGDGSMLPAGAEIVLSSAFAAVSPP